MFIVNFKEFCHAEFNIFHYAAARLNKSYHLKRRSRHPELVSGSNQQWDNNILSLRATNGSVAIQKKPAFSLVEMLMALLVASLLLAALAPVMTKKMNENVHITSDTTLRDGEYEIKEIAFGDSKYCHDITYDSAGNPLYCEGEYVVPAGVSNITVTAIGAGGGGGTAPTAGYTEYTTTGDASFTVPSMVNKIEATLISGGGAGGAGGQVKKTQTFVTSGNGGITNKTDNDTITVSSTGTGTWSIPAALKNQNLLASACGGGGGGGVASVADKAYGGGSGGYIANSVLNFSEASSFTYYVGGGGGGGVTYAGALTGSVGLPYGGGSGARNSVSNVTCGGIGGKGASCDSVPGDGGPSVLSSAGRGGTGTFNNIRYMPGAGGCTCYNSILYTNGGNGGTIGGGGGATFHWCSCGIGGAGGGGGASQILIGSGNYLNAPGGGGAATYNDAYDGDTNCPLNSASGGGGGGGTGGGNGGGIGSGNGKKGTGGADGAGKTGGVISGSIFGANYCNGGNGSSPRGDNGKSGAIRLTYLDYGPGGSGGGTGTMVPVQPVNVTPNEQLGIKIGTGGTGLKAGKISSTGVISEPVAAGGASQTAGGWGKPSILSRGSTAILNSNTLTGSYGTPSGCSNGVVSPGSPFCARPGNIHTGGTGTAPQLIVGGFAGGFGKSAGNGTTVGNVVYANGTIGGDGGQSEIFGSISTCTPGKGGTASNRQGKNATGYGGCGGGGGYGLSDGGNGAGGYARISWNMFWDSAAKAYKYAEIGAGGGGASGNAVTETVRVADAQIIKIRIGAGGIGAKVVNNIVIPATDGETTIFGDKNFIEIKAGGGGGGKSFSVTQDASVNGKGGEPSSICDVGANKYINNVNRCKKGAKGYGADDNENKTMGGQGASFSLTVNNKTYSGLAGLGGIQSTELDNSKGKTPENGNIASGGGGAALLIYNKISDSSQAANPSGGNGAPGRIILKLWK